MNYETVTFLSMNGKASEAIDFYEKNFKAEVLFKVTYKDMKEMDPSMVLEEGKETNISHCVLMLGLHKIMIAEDSMEPEREFVQGNNASLCIQSANKSEIEKMYNSIIQDSRTEIITPLGKNIFSEAYGIVKDPFGTIFQFMYDKRLAK